MVLLLRVAPPVPRGEIQILSMVDGWMVLHHMGLNTAFNDLEILLAAHSRDWLGSNFDQSPTTTHPRLVRGRGGWLNRGTSCMIMSRGTYPAAYFPLTVQS
jgi:hypothetical protein